MLLIKILKLEKTPVVLGLLLVFLTWTASHIIGRVTATPYLEYRISYLDGNEFETWKQKHNTDILDCKSKSPVSSRKGNIYAIRFSNLSNNIRLEEISIGLFIPPESNNKIVGTRFSSKAPAIMGDSVESCTSESIEIGNLNFHPKWEYTLLVATTDSDELGIVLLNAKQATILSEANTTTWMVKNETKVLFILLVIGGIIGLLYLYALVNTEDGKEAEGRDK